MTTPRRRVLRPERTNPEPDPRQLRLIQKRRAQLENDREALARWMSRLRRALRAVEKLQRKISRLERHTSSPADR